MIVLKYSKLGSLQFISHIELLRNMVRILRRADIAVNFSQGFNPHALMFFSPPIALGVGSQCEYVCFDTALPGEEVIEKYNLSVSSELKASKFFFTQKKPNLQAKIVVADYIFPTQFDGIEIGDEFIVSYNKKGEVVNEDVKDKIFEVFDIDGKLGMRIATGNSNLRADRIVPTLNKKFNREIIVPDVKKIAQYVLIDGEYLEVDKYLETLAEGVSSET